MIKGQARAYTKARWAENMRKVERAGSHQGQLESEMSWKLRFQSRAAPHTTLQTYDNSRKPWKLKASYSFMLCRRFWRPFWAQ